MFVPATQRTNVTESASVGAVIYKLQASDPDADADSLTFEVAEPISALDAHGHPVHNVKIKVGCLFQYYCLFIINFNEKLFFFIQYNKTYLF